jgi:outer membrane receptor protein involved in Fe transport
MNNFKRTLLHLAVTASMLPGVGLMAAPAADNGQPVTLAPMEVTSASVGRGSNVEKMDVSTTVLTREQIQHSPELTLDQILTQQMGVFIPQIPQNQADPTGQVISMRGSAGGEKVLVMVDGVPMNDGYFRTVDFSQIPKDTIDKVEIIRGGGGAAMWGNLALGGVINIITKAPVAGEKRLGFAYGNLNTKVGDAAATLFSNDKVTTGFNFNVIESDGYNTAPKYDQITPNLVTSKTRTHNGLWSTYFTPNDSSKYFVKIFGSELLQDQVTYSTANNQWYKLGIRTGGKTDYSNTGSFNFTGFYDYSQMNKANGSLTNIGSGSPNLLAGGTTVANSGVMSGQIESMNYGSYGASAYVEDRLSLKEWGSIEDIKLGVDARGVNTSDANNLYAQVGKTTSTAQFATYSMSGQTAFEGVFVQGTYKPKDIPLDATLGVREDLWQAFNPSISQQYYNNAALPGIHPSQSSLNASYNEVFNQIDPRFGLKYGFNNGIDLRGAVYRNFAAPGMNQLYRTYASSSTASLGNSNLTPETAFGQEIGIDFTGNKVKTTITGYHNDISNYINATTMCGIAVQTTACTATQLANLGLAGTNYANVSKNQNIGTVTTKGVEAFVQWDALPTLQLNASFARTFALIDSFNAGFGAINHAAAATAGGPLLKTGEQMPNIPTIMITQGGKWDIRPDLTFGWAIKTWPAYYTSTVIVTGNSMNNASTTADAHLSYKATKQIELYVNATNINNAYYIVTNSPSTNGSSSTAPSMGQPRTVLGGFKISF